MFRITHHDKGSVRQAKTAFNWYTIIVDIYLLYYYINGLVNPRACPPTFAQCLVFVRLVDIVGIVAVLASVLVYQISFRLPPHSGVLGLKLPVLLLLVLGILFDWVTFGPPSVSNPLSILAVLHVLGKWLTLSARLMIGLSFDVPHAPWKYVVTFLHDFSLLQCLVIVDSSTALFIFGMFFPFVIFMIPFAVADLAMGAVGKRLNSSLLLSYERAAELVLTHHLNEFLGYLWNGKRFWCAFRVWMTLFSFLLLGYLVGYGLVLLISALYVVFLYFVVTATLWNLEVFKVARWWVANATLKTTELRGVVVPTVGVAAAEDGKPPPTIDIRFVLTAYPTHVYNIVRWVLRGSATETKMDGWEEKLGPALNVIS